MKIGRNDLCPCGSGEKYKKCCGMNPVVSMDFLIEKELHEIQVEMFAFAMEHYQEEMEEYFEEWYEDFVIPDDAMEMFHFFACMWFITSVELEGKTILAEYIDRHILKMNRQRIKDILQSWRSARPSVSIIQHKNENQYIIVQDIFTDEVQKVKILDEDHIVETGELVLGTILPAGVTSVFFTTFLNLPASETEEMKDAIFTLYDNSGENSPVDFMATSFLEVLDLFMFGKTDVSIDHLEWLSPKHKEVAVNYQDYIEAFGHEKVVMYLGVVLWNTYCMRRNPTIKKSSVYEAALVYLVDKLLPLGSGITQKELAEVFNISSNSISSKYKELESVLFEEIQDLQDKLNTIDEDDFIDDEYLYEEGNNANSFINSKMMERELLKMEHEMSDASFESIDELNKFMNTRLHAKQSTRTTLSNKEKAQELLFDAYEASGNKRMQLANKALKLDPNHPDGYNILAEYETDPDKQLKLYLMGMEAGEKELGQPFFNENKGYFWGIVSTRPYMRAKYNYGMLLHAIGRLEEAIAQYEELLELNQMDNQAVRFQLFIAYVEKGLFQKAESLLQQYDEDTAQGIYNKFLIEYLQNGPSQKAKKLLKKAKDENLYVIDYVIGKKKLPKVIPTVYRLGDESEAIMYAEQYLHLWINNAKLIEWLKKA